MGLFIHTYIQPERIDPAEWEAAYQDSLRLLQHFPGSLIRLDRRRVGEFTRYVLTDNIVCERDTDDEHWSICGDSLSARRAEKFAMYRSLPRQVQGIQKTAPQSEEILWAATDSIDYIDSSGVDIFGAKTQGYPYHLAVLAVGILLENRFAGRCFVCGDIDGHQAGHMLMWINGVLGVELQLPVCVDGKRLYRRLDQAYSDPVLAIERFETLFRGTNEEELQLLSECAPADALHRRLAARIGGYRSLHQLGAKRIVAQYLAVVGKLDPLLALIATANRSRETPFPLEQLLEVVCNLFVTLPYEERQALMALARDGNELATIGDTLSRVFQTLAGTPTDTAFYLDKAELLDYFARLAPQQRSAFAKIIDDAEARCRASLATMSAAMDETANTDTAARALAVDGGVLVTECEEDAGGDGQAPDRDEPQAAHPGAAYILDQIHSQRESFPAPVKTAQEFGDFLRRTIAGNPGQFNDDARDHYLHLIGFGIQENGIPLAETAWQAIDREMDIVVLKHLAAFILVREREIAFWRWRIYILEHPQLWPHLVTPPDAALPI